MHVDFINGQPSDARSTENYYYASSYYPVLSREKRETPEEPTQLTTTQKAASDVSISGLDGFVKNHLTLLLIFGGLGAFLLFLSLHLAVICLVCRKRDDSDSGPTIRQSRQKRGRSTSSLADNRERSRHSVLQSGESEAGSDRDERNRKKKKRRSRSPVLQSSRDTVETKKVKESSRKHDDRQRDKRLKDRHGSKKRRDRSYESCSDSSSTEARSKERRRKKRDRDREKHRDKNRNRSESRSRSRSPRRQTSRPTAKIIPTSRTRLLSPSVHSVPYSPSCSPSQRTSSIMKIVSVAPQLGPPPSIPAPAPPVAPPTGPAPPPPPGPPTSIVPPPPAPIAPPPAQPMGPPPALVPPGPPPAIAPPQMPPPPTIAAPPGPPAFVPAPPGPPPAISPGPPPPPSPTNMTPPPLASPVAAPPPGASMLTQISQGIQLRPQPALQPPPPRPSAPKTFTHSDALMAAIAARRLKISSSTMLNNNNSVLLSNSEVLAATLAQSFPGIFSPHK